MGRGSAISRTITPPPGAHRAPAERRDPWSPSSSRDILAGVAVIAVLFAVLVVYTQDVPAGPRAMAAAPVPWAQPLPIAAPTDWSAIPLTTSAADLGPGLHRAIGARIERSRGAIERCVFQAGGVPGAGPGEIVLRLAPRSSALNVEGVEPSGPGSPSPELFDCARRVIDGDTIPAQSVVPGRRYRVLVQLE